MISGNVDIVNGNGADADFSCIVTEEGRVYWRLGVASFKKLAALVPMGSSYAKVRVLPQNGEKHPYLYPDGRWKLFVIGEAPAWFSDEHEEKVMAGFREWKREAYGLIDLDALLSMKNPRDITAGEPTSEDISNLAKWADVYNYLTVSPRNSVRDTITRAAGPSIGNDVWDYVYNMLYTRRLEAAAGSTEKQVSLIAALIGSMFTGITEWKYYVGGEKGYPFKPGADLVRRGYLVSSAGDWNLHSIATTKIVYTLPKSAVKTGRAFACAADESGMVYYRVGVDYCRALLEQYGLDEEKTVMVNVTPESYFEADSGTTVTVLNEETPAWYDDGIKAAVMDAYRDWHGTILSRIDCKGLTQCLTDEVIFGTHAALTEDIMGALKEWVAVWNKADNAGTAISSRVTAAGWEAVGATVWRTMDDRVLSNYKLHHRGCPGPTTCGVVEAYNGEKLTAAVDEFMGNTINDSYSSFIGSFIRDLCPDENGRYMYGAGAYLWSRGCIPMYDGTTWYLLSGPDGDVQVIYSALNDELLKG